MSVNVYSYDKCKTENRYVIKLYDYIEVENDKHIYYTVCCIIGEGNKLYDQSVIVRLLTEIINCAPVIGKLPSTSVSKLICNSYRSDNKWQREAAKRINEIALSFA